MRHLARLPVPRPRATREAGRAPFAESGMHHEALYVLVGSLVTIAVLAALASLLAS